MPRSARALIRRPVPVLASALVVVAVSSCGSNPAGVAGSGAANLPPQNNPAIADKDKKDGDATRRSLSGSIIDALSGQAVERAIVVVEEVQSTVISTPIPATQAPSPESSAQGGGGGGDEGDDADALNGAIPSPGVSTSPVAASGAPAPVGSALRPSLAPPSGVSASSVGPAKAASAAAGVMPSLAPAKVINVERNGKFELKDLPDTSVQVTVWAPGYQGVTYQGKLPAQIDLTLRPFKADERNLHALKGQVRLTNNQAAKGIAVELGAVPGRWPTKSATSDADGRFTMTQLGAGNHVLGAWTRNAAGEVNAFALLKEVPLAVGREKRSVSPTLVLRAPNAPWLLSGNVEGLATEAEIKRARQEKKPLAGFKGLDVRAYVQVNETELALESARIGNDGYFRLRVPDLPNGATYHIVASAQNELGQIAYAHRWGLNGPSSKVNLPLPKSNVSVTVDEASLTPKFSWEGSGADVAAYRLTLEDAVTEGDTIWEGWTTGTAIGLPEAKGLDLLKADHSYRYQLTAIKLGPEGKPDPLSVGQQAWESSVMSKPASFEAVRDKRPSKRSVTGVAKPDDTGESTTGPKDDAKPGLPVRVPLPSGSSGPRPSQHPRLKPTPGL